MIRRLCLRLLGIHECAVCGSLYGRRESLDADSGVCLPCTETALRHSRALLGTLRAESRRLHALIEAGAGEVIQ